MAIDVPQPPDEEFEERLSWSPFPEVGTARRLRVLESTPGPTPGPSASADDTAAAVEALIDALGLVREEVAQLREATAALGRRLDGATAVSEGPGTGALIDEVTGLRDEIVQLRRRISLRAGGAEPGTDAAAAARIADAVVERLIAAGAFGQSGPSRASRRK